VEQSVDEFMAVLERPTSLTLDEGVLELEAVALLPSPAGAPTPTLAIQA
jgi:hypothetical protein